MSSWGLFAEEDADLADFGAARLHGKVAYLGTVSADGEPRVYPVTPIIGGGRLLVFMEPTSPTGRDLRNTRRYAIPSSVGGIAGEGGEFSVRGTGSLVEDADTRRLAVELSTYEPADRYVLFEFQIQIAQSTVYENGTPIRKVWHAS